MKVGDQIRVTPMFHHLASEVQYAAGEVASAENQEQIEDAWPRLCAAREALYRYVEGYEKELNVDRATVLRF